MTATSCVPTCAGAWDRQGEHCTLWQPQTEVWKSNQSLLARSARAPALCPPTCAAPPLNACQSGSRRGSCAWPCTAAATARPSVTAAHVPTATCGCAGGAAARAECFHAEP